MHYEPIFGSPVGPTFLAQRLVIGVGDFAVSNDSRVTLTTYALGSCVGVIAFDPTTRTGGILHVMLPDSSICKERAATQPAMFADTGLPLFLRELTEMKADLNHLKIYLAGGACVLNGPDTFRIGERNSLAVKAWLARQGLRVSGTDLAGTLNRTLHLELSTGLVTVKLPSGDDTFSLG